MTRLPKTMVVAGVMSGTSADGVDVALVQISPPRIPGGAPRIKLLGHEGFTYPKAVRDAVLRAMDAHAMSVADMARLHWRLGEVYADCVEKACSRLGVSTVEAHAAHRVPRSPAKPGRHTLRLVGMHGQTIYHQALPNAYAGRPVRATWQVGEAAVVAERLRLAVISDFRPADLAAGGQGAPLVPMLDVCLFASARKNRLLLNLGGIANITALPAGGDGHDAIAFDTGPANMVLDALMQALFKKRFDRGGKIAARGHVVQEVVDDLQAEPYFVSRPPKSCGREQFGKAFAGRLQTMCQAHGASHEDILATAAELTCASIDLAFGRFVEVHFEAARPTEMIVAGGGVNNEALMKRLRVLFGRRGVKVLPSDELGMPAQAKEAVAFALLAWLSWHGLPGNIPAATGAMRAVVLGKATC